MLKFEFWSIFEAVANIIILFVLLKIFLFKPINKMKNARTQSVQKDIDDAAKAKQEAEELRQQYEESISEAKEEANRIIMKAHEIVNAASETIENERRRVLQQAQSQIADLAIEAASKIVGANLDDEKNRRLVDEFLSEEEGDK